MKVSLIVAAVSLMAVTSPGFTQDHDGHNTLTVTQISGLTNTGAKAPQYDAACRSRYGKWMGQSIRTDWNINPSTLIMSASTTAEGNVVALFPLGLSGSYSFMSDGVPSGLSGQGINRVMFELSLQLGSPESRMLGELGAESQCLIES